MCKKKHLPGEVAHARLVVVVPQEEGVIGRLAQVHQQAHARFVPLGLGQAHGNLKRGKIYIINM